MFETLEELENRIRRLAYHLWEQDGRQEGRSDEYWERARQQIEAEGASFFTDPRMPPQL
jgi:Protein of unknown function (DUF2934)